MKKSIVLMIIILLCLMFCGCTNNEIKEKEDIEFDVKMRVIANSNLKNENMIINSYNNLQDIFGDNLSIYSYKQFDDFDFKKNVLLYINYACKKSSTLQVTEIIKDNNTFLIDMYDVKDDSKNIEDADKTVNYIYLIGVEKEKITNINEFIVIPNQYEYVKVEIVFAEECHVNTYITYAIKNKKFNYKYSGIDLDTLTIYRGKCCFTEDVKLCPYYDNGVSYKDTVIENIIFENLNINFYLPILIDNLSIYDYIVNDDESIVFEDNGIVYTFVIYRWEEYELYYLKSFKTTKPLIGKTHDDTLKALKILYNNEKFETGRVTVKILEDGYLVEYPYN